MQRTYRETAAGWSHQQPDAEDDIHFCVRQHKQTNKYIKKTVIKNCNKKKKNCAGGKIQMMFSEANVLCFSLKSPRRNRERGRGLFWSHPRPACTTWRAAAAAINAITAFRGRFSGTVSAPRSRSHVLRCLSPLVQTNVNPANTHRCESAATHTQSIHCLN